MIVSIAWIHTIFLLHTSYLTLRDVQHHHKHILQIKRPTYCEERASEGREPGVATVTLEMPEKVCVEKIGIDISSIISGHVY